MSWAAKRAPHKPSLLPTAAACTLAVLALTMGTSALTGGFEHATFESLRSAQAFEGRMQAPPVELVDSAGRRQVPWSPVPQTSTAPVRIVDFIYTQCLTVCQALGSTYQQMQQQLKNQQVAGVELLSISFDRVNDDRTALAAYAKRHGADPRRWQVAIPAHAAEQQALLRGLGVVTLPDGIGGYVHNGALHLIDGTGQVHAIYDYADWPRAVEHAARLTGAVAR